MGTKAGALKARQKQIEKHGSEEAYREYQRHIASKGGRMGVGHKFAHGMLDQKQISKMGTDKRWGKNEG